MAVRPIAAPTRARRRLGSRMTASIGGAVASITQKPAVTMKTPSPAASIRYSGQWAFSAPRAALISAPRGEFGVQRHPAVDEQRDPVDVITVVGGQPDRGAGDVVGLAD